MKVEGACLCEAVKFSFTHNGEPHFDACHCGMCRKWNGSPAMMVKVGEDLVITGKEKITEFKSSEWATRGFCSLCGSNLYYKLNKGDFSAFSLGTLKNNEKFKFTEQIFIDHKPGNYSFSNETKMMTEEEVLKAFS